MSRLKHRVEAIESTMRRLIQPERTYYAWIAHGETRDEAWVRAGIPENANLTSFVHYPRSDLPASKRGYFDDPVGLNSDEWMELYVEEVKI